MKNILYLLIIIFLCSCMNPFDSRKRYYYNNANKPNKIYPDIDMPSYSPDDKTDPFNSDADWNRIDYKFNGNELYNYFMKISFEATTVPIYSFFIPNDGREWKKSSENYYDEYTFDASDDGNTTASPILPNPIKISPMTVHRYGKNPLVKHNGEYNSSERIKRFFFIRAEGSAAVKLDNYLIAIDTYSKFIFAYAKITDYNNILGQLLPTEFQAIEHHHQKRKFYEYDPIGFIDENKNIILYQVYADDMTAHSSEYVPRYTGTDGNAARPIDKTTTGHSPYATEPAKK